MAPATLPLIRAVVAGPEGLFGRSARSALPAGEELEAGVEAGDLDVVAAALLPVGSFEDHVDLQGGLVAPEPEGRSVGAVPERPGDAERSCVLLPGAAVGNPCPEPGEGEVQDRLSHLLAEAATLPCTPEPGPGRYRAGDAEVLRAGILGAHDPAVVHRHRDQLPVRGGP